MILDDLLKDVEEARSETVCRSIADWLQHVAFTRLERGSKVLAIATRWSDRDPMGWLLREQPGWEVLHLPAVSEGDRDPLGRPPGTALWESTYPISALQSIRSAVGPSAWQCLYQGNPVAAQGTVFRREWFHYFRDVPAKFNKIVQSWDTAFKSGAANDFSVCTTWGVTDSFYHMLHLWRGKVEFPELKKQVASLAEQWGPHAILIEDHASGQSLVQELETATNYPVLPIKVDHDKETRASAVTAFFESGKVLFPQDVNWLGDLEDELAGFPGAAHDDIVDSVTQALNYLRPGADVFGVLALFASGGLKRIYDKIVATTREVVTDVFGREQPSPRDENVFAKELYPHEIRLRGLDPAKLNAAEGWTINTPPCEKCGSVCTVRLNDTIHCNQCAHDSWPNGAPMAVFATRGGVQARRVR